MWFQNFNPVRQDPGYTERKLITEKGYISLDIFMSGVCRIAEDSGSIIESQKEAHEKTLTYLKNLLERGEVKVGKIIRLKEGETRPDPETIIGIPVFEDIRGTPTEIIEYIRTEWNTNPEFSESFDCVIALPENPWPVWR